MVIRLTSALFATFLLQCAALASTPFPNSVNTLPPAMARAALTSTEMDKTMPFAISLRMRNFAELQKRVELGELISRAELDTRYLPLADDYAAVGRWLTSQGFAITRQDSTRLAIFARGSVKKIGTSLGASFTAAEVDGKRRAVATTVPSLPDKIAPPVLGINGLQPLRPRRPQMRESRISNAPPYYPSEIIKAYNGMGAAERGTTLTGAGETIAIVIDVPPLTSDLTQFWNAAGIAQTLDNYSFVNVNNATFGGTSGEESLDAEWTSGMAPGSKVRVYCAGSLDEVALDACFQKIIDELPTNSSIHQLSISLGIGETFTTGAQLDTDAQYFAMLAVQGVSTFVSSGDGGSTPDDLPSGPRNTGPLQVESYSSDPNVTGVGGTSLILNGSNGARGAETAWFDSGGGASIHFARPIWQPGSGSFRLVPDVSLPADPVRGAFVVLSGNTKKFGGTSWSAPAWAGICALLNQARALNGKTPLGLLNPRLYPLAGSADFFDIVSGANSSGANSGGNYSTANGYDEVTGLGSPNITNLVAALAANPTFTVGSPSVTISQVYGGGGSSGAPYQNDFIELYNRGDETVDLSKYSVQYATISSWSKTNLIGSIKPGAYYLIAEAGNLKVGALLPDADRTMGKIDLNPLSGKVALVSNQTTIPNSTFNPIGGGFGVIDFVGYGNVNGSEGPIPASAPTATTAVLRALGGAQDTDNNAADFGIANPPTPRNSTTLTVPDLKVAISHAGAFKQADPSDVYTIVVSNGGAGATSGNVSVALALPADFTPVSIAGTGWTAGADLQSATRVDSLAGGASYPALTMTVSVSASAGSTVINEASVAGGGEYNAMNDAALDSTAITPLTKSESWRYQYFGTTANSGPAADGAVTSGDGLSNLLKYAFGLDPRLPTIAPVTVDTLTGHLRLTAVSSAFPSDVLISAQVTSDLLTPASWSASNVTIDTYNATIFQAHDNAEISGNRYIRLQVTRP